MSQRPTNRTDSRVLADMQRRIEALERIIPGPLQSVDDIHSLRGDVSDLDGGVQSAGSSLVSVQAQIDAVVAQLSAPRVTTLPTTGLVDGMVVPWQTAAPYGQNYGVTWMMKYRKGATYPWECVGGHPMYSWTNGSGTVGTNSDGASGPLQQLNSSNGGNVQDLPIPYTGEWHLVADAGYIENSSGNANFMAMQPGVVAGTGVESGTPAKQAIVDGSPYGVAPYGAYGAPAHKERSIIVQAGSTVGVRYQATRNYANVYGPYFSLIPVRVTT